MIPAFVLATVVTTHFHVPNNSLRAKVYSADGSSELCTLPCTLDLEIGAHVRIAFEGELDSARDVEIEGSPGKDTILTVTRGGRAWFATGIVIAAIGGGAAAIGLGFAALSQNSHAGPNAPESTTTTVGRWMFIAGALVGAGGLAMIFTRTWTPSVDQQTDTSAAATTSKLVSPPSTPLSLSLTF